MNEEETEAQDTTELPDEEEETIHNPLFTFPMFASSRFSKFLQRLQDLPLDRTDDILSNVYYSSGIENLSNEYAETESSQNNDQRFQHRDGILDHSFDPNTRGGNQSPYSTFKDSSSFLHSNTDNPKPFYGFKNSGNDYTVLNKRLPEVKEQTIDSYDQSSSTYNYKTITNNKKNPIQIKLTEKENLKNDKSSPTYLNLNSILELFSPIIDFPPSRTPNKENVMTHNSGGKASEDETVDVDYVEHIISSTLNEALLPQLP